MAAAIRAALGAPLVKLRRLPWWAIRLAAPAVPLFRELLEMRYLWQRPVRMGNARLVAALGAEPHTPLDAAVRETLRGMGCLG
jgi:nucleoside-diphosphate-sugar epimerase